MGEQFIIHYSLQMFPLILKVYKLRIFEVRAEPVKG